VKPDVFWPPILDEILVLVFIGALHRPKKILVISTIPNQSQSSAHRNQLTHHVHDMSIGTAKEKHHR
jgi:hypothetical protein